MPGEGFGGDASQDAHSGAGDLGQGLSKILLLKGPKREADLEPLLQVLSLNTSMGSDEPPLG